MGSYPICYPRVDEFVPKIYPIDSNKAGFLKKETIQSLKVTSEEQNWQDLGTYSDLIL